MLGTYAADRKVGVGKLLVDHSPLSADSILQTVRVDADLYKRIVTRAHLFASFGCISENGSDC